MKKSPLRRNLAGHPFLSLLLFASCLACSPAAFAQDRLQNISGRTRVDTGSNVLIGGFIVGGTGTKKVIVRALGPSLAVNGSPVVGRLEDPTLEVYASGSNVPLAFNDNWKDSQRGQIEATGLQPANDLESAAILGLDPGSYTVVVRGKSNGTGIGLIEVYDLAPNAAARLLNISTRGVVQSGDNLLIGGFIIAGGTIISPGLTVIVRALGPSLSDSGVANPLGDPTLEIVNSNGVSVASNDDWKSGSFTDIQGSGLAPSDDRESAIKRTLPADGYTAVIRGKNGATGVALVEVYEATP